MVTMGLTSLKSAFESLSDPDLSPLEKISSLAMSIGMVLPGIIKLFSSFTGAISRHNAEMVKNNMLNKLGIKDLKDETLAKAASLAASEKLSEEERKE
jgi:hypothetical protein